MFNSELYDEFLVENNIIRFYDGPVELSSGGITYWYANFRELIGDKRKVVAAARFIYDYMSAHGIEPTNAFAVPEGPKEFASSINDILQAKLELVPATSLRAGYKTYGSPLDKYSVGPVYPWIKPILLEDATTTGNSSSEYLSILQELGVPPLALISMLNREERRKLPDGRTVKEYIENCFGTTHLSMTSASRILPLAVEAIKPRSFVLKGLREELDDSERYSAKIKI